MEQGTVYLLAGPSGSGKDTLTEGLLSYFPEIVFFTKHTNRKPRPEEKVGVHYHYLSEEKFGEMQEGGKFFTWSGRPGTYYGVEKERLFQLLGEGLDLIIHMGTFYKDMKLFKDEGILSRSILLLSCPTILEKRLRIRGTENEREIKVRMQKAMFQYSYVLENELLSTFDYRISNDHSVSTPLEALRSIVLYERGEKMSDEQRLLLEQAIGPTPSSYIKGWLLDSQRVA